MRGLRVAALRGLYRVAFRLMQVATIVLRHESRGVKCVLTCGDEVLLVRHTYGGRRTWRLPGGALRRGEQPLHGAAREMREELGLRELDLHVLSAVDMRLDWIAVNLTCVHAELADRAVRIDPVEIAQAQWFALDDLPQRLGEDVEPLLDVLFEQL